MTNKIVVKIKDKNVKHEPSFITDSNNIHYIRNLTPNNNGDLIINKEDIVIYTDQFVRSIDLNAKYNICLLIESPEIKNDAYEFISKNNNNFDLVLTFDKKLLDRGENFKLNLYGTCWLHESYIKIWKKTKICSFITSSKKITSGHHFRYIISNYITSNNLNIDIYGDKYKQLPYFTTKAFDYEHSGRHISNQKIIGIKEYMFSIVIENCKRDYYFTEKLIDCFLTGTVPIYYGCPSIKNFFNIKGMIIIDNLNDLKSIINSINEKLYHSMKEYIEENFNTSAKYKTFSINENAILNILNK
uniref:Fucosyltransferase C-terminal domain-containing protein n=1 Tax=Nucleocytoviricota sp. TaxID=2809609 RepID=A0A9E8G8G3_9VIRU|nr:hypothetical protein [Nucleocytoviricota sp.]UZT29050.1 hypothetical protein [Nucleocytoviricota sp.]